MLIRFEEKQKGPHYIDSSMPTGHNEVDHKDDAIFWNFYRTVFPHTHQPKPTFTLYKPPPISSQITPLQPSSLSSDPQQWASAKSSPFPHSFSPPYSSPPAMQPPSTSKTIAPTRFGLRQSQAGACSLAQANPGASM